MSIGYIYVITNEGKPGLCKVGFTERNPEDRAKELDGTHDPFPHKVVYAVKLSDARNIEKKVHEDLKEYQINTTGTERYRTGREWFRCSVSQCRKAIKKYDIITDDDESNDEYLYFSIHSSLAKKFTLEDCLNISFFKFGTSWEKANDNDDNANFTIVYTKKHKNIREIANNVRRKLGVYKVDSQYFCFLSKGIELVENEIKMLSKK